MEIQRNDFICADCMDYLLEFQDKYFEEAKWQLAKKCR